MPEQIQLNNWDNFWKDKGKEMEWSPEDILSSKDLFEYSEKIKDYFSKEFENIRLLEIGAGMGITSLYFASKGMKVTLLDKSKESMKQSKEYWGRLSNNYIISDLFDYHKKYDVVTSFGLCEHFIGDKRKKVLYKHINLLKNKGMAIISVPYRYGIFYRAIIILQKLTNNWHFGIEKGFTKKEFINFAVSNKLGYEISVIGFYGSAYDLFVRKPLKLFHIRIKRRFNYTPSIFDRYFGSGIIGIFYKNDKKAYYQEVNK